MLKKIKGQSMLEYVIILTAIVTAIIAAVTVLGKQNDTAGLGKLMHQTGERIKTESAKIPEMIK